MKILLDSNIYIRDLAFQSNDIRDFFAITSSSMSLLCVPELVLDEVRAHQLRVITEHEEALRKLTSKIRSASGYIPSTPSNVAAAARSSFESTVEALFREPWVQLLPYPDVNHRDVVARELLGLKPFNREKHTGYRDYLLWRCVLSECLSPAEPVVFISENVRDFGNGEGGLHADLQVDLQRLDIDDRRLVYMSSLAAFNKRFIGVCDALPRFDTKGREYDTCTWLAEHMRSAVSNDEIICVCLDEESRDAHQVTSFDVQAMEVREGLVYPSGELQIPVLVEANVGFLHRETLAEIRRDLSLTMMVLATHDQRPLRCEARRIEGDQSCRACSHTHWDSRGLFLDWVEHSMAQGDVRSG